MEHYARFSEIAKVLKAWSVTPSAPTAWLRPIQPASAAQAAAALTAYKDILAHLAAAYQRGDMEDAGNIIGARAAMMRLDDEAEKLAVAGLGVPFF